MTEEKTYTAEEVAKMYNWPAFTPADDDVFYHYCSNETLRLIAEKRTLRLTDINMMTDYGESIYGYGVFKQAAADILSLPKPPAYQGIDQKFFDQVDHIFRTLQTDLFPVVASLSHAPDVLSQWREYADRGVGVSVGISGKALKNMPLTMLKVKYDPKDSIKTMISMLLALYAMEDNRGHKRGSEFNTACAVMAAHAFALKNPAFAEEKEVRCLHMLVVNEHHGGKRLDDENALPGGSTQPVKFLTRASGSIVAHVDLPFPSDPQIDPIKHVWLGPKNPNPAQVVEYLLNGHGHKGYTVNKSIASYR